MTDDHGKPLAGVTVTLSRETAGEPLLASHTTDKLGRYAFKVDEELFGKFLLRFEAEGYAPAEGFVEPLWGRVKIVDMELVPWEEAVREDPDTAVWAGFEAFEAGKLEESVAYFEAALAVDTNRADARRGLAEVHLRRDRPAEAAEEVERYLDLRPGDTGGLRLAYDVYRALEDEEGIERTKEALVAAGAGAEVASAVYNRGVDRYRVGALEEASARFREAIELDAGLAVASVALASIAYAQRRFSEAAHRAGDILEADPDNVTAAQLRFLALEAANAPDVDEAFATYAQLAPRAAVSLVLQRAVEDLGADRLEGAETSLLRLLAIRPDQPDAHHLLGMLYHETGEVDEAEEHLERFLELAPDHRDADTARTMLEDLRRPRRW